MLVASERVYYKVAFATFEGIYCTYLEFKSVKQSPAKTQLRDLSGHGLSFLSNRLIQEELSVIFISNRFIEEEVSVVSLSNRFKQE